MNADKTREFAKARRLFPHAGKTVYFNSASYGPFCRPVEKAITDNLKLRLEATRDDTRMAMASGEALRAGYAKMIGASKKDVGLGLNTSFGLNVAAFGLPLKKGDEILVSDLEFPAIIYTWQAAAKQRGLKVRVVESTDRCFDIDALKKAITARSRVVSVSFVQFFNGFKLDLKEISLLCKKHGMYLVVDGIQGVGVETLDVKKAGIDILSCGCQKWLLGPQGCGFFYLSEEIRDSLANPFMSYLGVDWKMQYSDMWRYNLTPFDSARRFELGYYVILNMLGMKASCDIISALGVRNIQSHNHTLLDRLIDFIKTDTTYTITSRLEGRHRSSILSFTCDNVQALHKAIIRHKILLSLREGSIRVSAHLFNNAADIDRLIKVLKRFSAKR
jgi:selenocysteine lyase/cysteine desulfurase